MDETTKPARELVNSLLDDLESRGWTIEDYNATVDPYEPVGLEITLSREHILDELDPEDPPEGRSDIAELKEVIDEMEADTKEGVPITRVVSEAAERLDVPTEAIEMGIVKLRSRGEIYEPQEDHLRSV